MVVEALSRHRREGGVVHVETSQVRPNTTARNAARQSSRMRMSFAIVRTLSSLKFLCNGSYGLAEVSHSTNLSNNKLTQTADLKQQKNISLT